MKFLAPERVEGFFLELAGSWDVRLPVILADGTRGLGAPGDGVPAFLGGSFPCKPTAAFFPQQEPVFFASAAGVRSPEAAVRPILVAGLHPRDVAALRFADRFFSTGYRDEPYCRRRSGAAVIAVSGYSGQGGSLVRPAGEGCDLELCFDGSRWLAAAYSDVGRELIPALPECDDDGAMARLQREADARPDPDGEVLAEASRLLREERVPDSFWEEIAARCIACTGCNLVCPTCTCFGVQDWRYADGVERSRMWDSCQLDGFMREASGHNPLGTALLRTRRRIHHKLAADPERWGESGCFRCGRCDGVCPTGIGIVAVAREMAARFGGEYVTRGGGE